jgi:general secretion pathway protein F
MPDRVLAEFLGRLGVALAAGIDPRTAVAAETARVPRRWRPALEAVRRGLAEGAGLGESMRRAGRAFPPLVVGLATVGDRTGREAEVLRDASRAIERAARTRRELLASLVGPALQLAAAIAVVGLLIVITGVIADLDGRPVDILGLGLSGFTGLKTYLGGLAAVAAVTALLVPWAARNWSDRGVLRRCLAWVPLLGPAIRAAEEASWCRAVSLGNHAGIEVRGMLTLAATVAPGLRIDAAAVESRLRGGAGLEEALRATGRLSARVVEGVGLGDMTGTIAETLDRLADRLEEESRAGFAAAAKVVGFLAWAAVACLIAAIVIRFASFYVGLIDQASRPL